MSDLPPILRDHPLPLAWVELPAFDHNLAMLLEPAMAHRKRVRLATKSLRCPQLLQRAVRLAAGQVDGLMTFTARETLLWAQQGREILGEVAQNLLLGYPLGSLAEARMLAQANQHAHAAAMVDARQHVEWLQVAAVEGQITIPVWLDLDLGWRPLDRVHLGVRRSPLRSGEDVMQLADFISQQPNLKLEGVMGYEAHVAGLPDQGRLSVWQNPLKRLLKRRSWPDVLARRQAAVLALRPKFPHLRVNGGGSGSVHHTAQDPSVTELTIGSGLLAPHLFDGYHGLKFQPALKFALPVTRLPAPGYATCHGGGWIASGSAGLDRLPLPVFPPGLELLSQEGAGEVQTPLKLPDGVQLQIGDPVTFRPAKAGELAEIFGQYALIHGSGHMEQVPTYRGLGWLPWG